MSSDRSQRWSGSRQRRATAVVLVVLAVSVVLVAGWRMLGGVDASTAVGPVPPPVGTAAPERPTRLLWQQTEDGRHPLLGRTVDGSIQVVDGLLVESGGGVVVSDVRRTPCPAGSSFPS